MGLILYLIVIKQGDLWVADETMYTFKNRSIYSFGGI